MSMRAIANEYTEQVGWAPVAVAANKTSAAIDMANLTNNMIELFFGLWTDGTHTFKLTECTTSGGTYSDVAAGDMVFGGGQSGFVVVSSTATATTPQKVSYIGKTRFIKVVDTVTGATTGAICGVKAIGKPRKMTSTT